MTEISLKFIHGCGDASCFAHMIPLWTKRGYVISVECTPDKRIIFEAAGARATNIGIHTHHWGHPPGTGSPDLSNHFLQNKAGWNLTQPPLPNIGKMENLWDEFIDVKLSLDKFIGQSVKTKIESIVDKLPRPIILAHPQGNTGSHLKNLSHDQQKNLLHHIIDWTDGSVILLDWDNRTFKLPNFRIRHMTTDYWPLNLMELYWLMKKSDLVIGIDSGPLHFARFAATPTLGVWTKHFPSRFVLPNKNNVNFIHSDTPDQNWVKFRRLKYNIVSGNLADIACKMLGERKYLAEPAADTLLQHLVFNLRQSVPLSPMADRHRSFDMVFKHLKGVKDPTCVEIGCMRQEDDWGAGMSSYVIGYFLSKHGGTLKSVDLSTNNIELAKVWCQSMPVTFENVHSHKFLENYTGPKVDFLYLDGADTDTTGFRESCLEEAKLCQKLMSDTGMILIDDSPWQSGKWIGKGEYSIKWLQENGWDIKYSGYQTIMVRNSTPITIQPVKKAKPRLLL